MRRYSYVRTYSWSQEIAYLAGLIAADGCLINDGRHINITSKDIEIIDIVMKILDLYVKVPEKKSGYGTTSYHLQFSNVALYDFLHDAGIYPNKSKTIDKVSVPELYFPDFLRGYFDGDGTIYGFKDKRWKNSYMYYVGFASASEIFLKWLRQKNSEHALTENGSLRVASRVFSLQYAKADSRKIFHLMYYSDGLPALSRKYLKFVAFLHSDPYTMHDINARVLESVDRLA